MAILAAGIGFESAAASSRIGLWTGFTGAQLGHRWRQLTSFCFGIIVGGVVVDKIGYGKLIVARSCSTCCQRWSHSAPDGTGSGTACMFPTSALLFGLANGTLEAVANPLVSTLFRKIARTISTSFMQAGRPARCSAASSDGSRGWHASELEAAARFFVPTALYGVAFLGQKFPGRKLPPNSASPRCSTKRSARRPRGVRPGGPLLQRSTGRSSRSSRAASSSLAAWGYLAWASRRLLIVVGINTISRPISAAFVTFITHAARLCRAPPTAGFRTSPAS